MATAARPTAVFDLDGTLADTAPDLIGAVNDLFAAKGWAPLALAAARMTAGRGGRALITRGLQANGRAADQDAVAALFDPFLEAYAARIDRETRIFPGVENALAELSDAGWALSVCTNKPEGLAVDLLGRLKLDRWFQAIVGADTLPVRKPDPRPVWAAIDRSNGSRDRAVMIGDSVTDRDAARAAEIPVALVTFGYSLEPVSSLTPDALVSAFRDIPGVVTRLSKRRPKPEP